MDEARLILTCGLPGSGKTTLAIGLATRRGGVRLTKDGWQRALGSTPWDRDFGEKLERQLWHVAEDALGLGVSVVLDFGLWARAERAVFRPAARRMGVGVELHYLNVPVDEFWRRIEARNSAPSWDEVPITRTHLDEWRFNFEAPDAGELALFDSAPR
jgi:predicted kinase